MQTETLIRRNFLKSGGIIFVAFFLNAGLNVVLLGLLARQGGMGLVGIWSLLNIFLLYVLIADLGFTNALTRHVALNGVLAALAPIVWLISRLAVVWGILALGSLAAGLVDVADSDMILGLFLAATAGCLQVASNWIVALRLGQHEQFWFNVKTIVRVVTQTALIIVLLFFSALTPPIIFGLGLFLGGAIEAVFTLWLVREYASEFVARKTHPPSDWRKLAELGRGFGVLNVLQRLQFPVLQSFVGAMAGIAALGTFTVALRIPVVLSQSIGEAMRVLLPGLSQLQQEGDRCAVLRMLRDGILVQLLILGPICILYLVVAEDALLLWLGSADPVMVVTTRLIMLGVFTGSLGAPYFWALQAFGDARRVVLFTALRLAFLFTAGAVVLWLTRGSIVAFSVVFVTSSFLGVALLLYRGELHWNIVRESLALIAWWPVGLFLVGAAAFALAADFSQQSASPFLRFSLVVGVMGIPCVVALLLLYRKDFFICTNTDGRNDV